MPSRDLLHWLAMPTNTPNPWLEIDIKGFAQVLRNKGISRIALEPISNALDTEATEIEVSFTQTQGRATLFVKDDDPDGFADLRDAYTLFAPSKRRHDPTKRGRFGQGDKELIAICFNGGYVEVASTTGTVSFTQAGRSLSKRTTKGGTTLTAEFRCNQAEAREFEILVRSLIIPNGIKATFNGEVLPDRTPVKVVRETLPTKLVDDDGNLSDTRRQTDIEIYEPVEGETPFIYELGVPVVEHDGRFHVNVMQKVPLNTARDNVTPAYLRRLREIVLNETFDVLTSVDHKQAWVTDALPNATEEALRSHVLAIHGANAVIFDPSNPEASKRAIDEGRSVVYGRQFSTDTWTKIKQYDILKPAGQVIETFITATPDGTPPIPDEKWTEAMRQMAGYVRAVGKYLLGFEPTVEYHIERLGGKQFVACWGGQTITFNLRHLGKHWPETANQQAVDELLLHEFAHHKVKDHLSDDMTDEACRLGAKLRTCPVTLAYYRHED